MKNNIISLCLETNCSWPFVTISEFETRHERFLEQSRADEIALVPLISEENRGPWERFSVSSQGWVQDGINAREGDNQQANDILPYIHQGETRDPGPANPFYAAYWQIAPVPVNPKTVNFNLFSNKQFQNTFDWM
jgi:hypothetical protein